MSRVESVVLALALSGLPQMSVSPRQQPSSPDHRMSESALELQVLLDRAHFSPGEIDGVAGTNTRKGSAAFAAARGQPADADLRQALGAGAVPVTVPYTITAADVAGPFAESIPADMVDKAKLSHLSYTSPLEALGERFHASPALLRALNPGASFAQNEQIVVPNIATEPPPAPAAAEVVVSKSDASLKVLNGREVIFYAPVTSGSEKDPLPIGVWKVNAVSRNPSFNYNPALFWDANPAHAKAKIPPGPNNPVGVVWIDLSKEHYGIHGTPEPSKIGHSASHGCVRLTNWDALTVASLVKPGTTVRFEP
jgi:lipoprotein-anchoring transpeptidase ErfK/SrfK